ncbi:MAG TPA: TfoX/Sxy family protein [Anaeromyxobacter sp.]|nr:TfoX/Sxy family protein [Anaeromyxobacter sp.]
MACSRSFADHALDLLSGLGPVQARRMFGGFGVYARGVMFGLLDDDELFLRVDGESEGRFTAAGCRRWVYPGNTTMSTSYFRPPDEAHEDPEAMQPWARLGLEAALRRKAAKDAGAAAAAARRAERERKAKAQSKAPSPARRRATARAGRPARKGKR